jgi:PhzF family phenazine biosynthesis protein
VIITEQPLGAALMQRLTQELRQFETIFLSTTGERSRFRARVFTMEEELDFAGHPIVGAAAVLHEAFAAGEKEANWTIDLNQQSVEVESRWHGDQAAVAMRQAPPQILGVIDAASEPDLIGAFGLSTAERDAALPMEVVTTGLPYLIVPVTAAGLERARIVVTDLDERLARVGAAFAYVFDARNRDGRTWDNLGKVEDIATGSAAGPVAGYLVKHGLAEPGTEIILHQGRFAGRPSAMRTVVDGDGGGIVLSGDVRMIARGSFEPSIGSGTASA